MSVTTMRRPALTAAQRVSAARRARQIRSGEVKVPAACPTCYSPSLEKDDAGLRCLSCGRVSKAALVKRIRQQRLRRFLLDGAL